MDKLHILNNLTSATLYLVIGIRIAKAGVDYCAFDGIPEAVTENANDKSLRREFTEYD